MNSTRSWKTLIGVAASLGALAMAVAAASAVTTDDLVGQVSQSQYAAYQTAIEDMGLGHYGGQTYNQDARNRDGWAGDGTLGNQEARLYLGERFQAMGLAVSIQGTYKNVVAELAGSTTPGRIFIVSAHYDTTASGTHPGGDDNASGTAAVVEAARVLSQFQFKSTLRFICFNAEEDQMLGSADYVNNVVVPGGQNVVGIINLDMILRPGWDSQPAHAKDLDIMTRPVTNCLDWVGTFIAEAHAHVPSLAINPAMPYTDHWTSCDQGPFVSAGFAGLSALENTAADIWWNGSNAYYHGPDDVSGGLANNPLNPSGITYDYAFAADVVRATVATMGDQAELIPEPATLALVVLAGLAVLRRRS